MTDEKKPPQAVDGQLVFESARGVRQVIAGAAHVVISLDAAGTLDMQGYNFGEWSCIFARTTDARLLGPNLQHLIAELRHELKHQRHCTHAEGLAFAKHYIHGQPLVLSPETDCELMALAKPG